MRSGIDLVLQSIPLFCRGALVTLQVLASSTALSLVLGVLFGTLTCNRLKVPILSQIVEGVTFVLRAVPFFVQLLIVYFVLPDLCGFNLSAFVASVISLGVCSSGYVAQIIRLSLNAIPAVQWEMSFSLGYTSLQALRYTIFPQSYKLILPSLCNELDALLKSTAVISTIGMVELTRVGMNIVSREMEPVPIYLAIAGFYLCMSAAINCFTRALEKYARG